MKKYTLFILASVLLMLTACNHKELCYHHPHTARVRIDVDWTQFPEEQPTGMTVMAFPTDGGRPTTVLSNTLSHVYVNLQAGLYHTLAFNQSTSEFGSFQFRGMDSWNDAEVVAQGVNSRWYTARAEGERVATEPEWLGTDNETDVRVTDEMVEATGTHHGTTPEVTTDYVISTLYPQNIVWTMHVTVHIPGGVYNLRSARAALSGMTEGVKFSNLRRSDAEVTHLLEEWSLAIDKDNPVKGTLTSSFKCLGLPGNHAGKVDENDFLLSMLLVDGKTQVDVPFQVGHLIETADDGTLTLYLELTLPEALPDVKPEGGSGSGFDATVEDWGDEIEHEIQM